MTGTLEIIVSVVILDQARTSMIDPVPIIISVVLVGVVDILVLVGCAWYLIVRIERITGRLERMVTRTEIGFKVAPFISTYGETKGAAIEKARDAVAPTVEGRRAFGVPIARPEVSANGVS